MRHTVRRASRALWEATGATAQQYAQHLNENRRDVHGRLRSGREQASPVERVWIEKDDGDNTDGSARMKT